MKAIDPRTLSDIDLLLYVAMGPLPRPGWPGRRRLIARRLAEVALVAAGVVVAGYLLVLGLWIVA